MYQIQAEKITGLYDFLIEFLDLIGRRRSRNGLWPRSRQSRCAAVIYSSGVGDVTARIWVDVIHFPATHAHLIVET